MTYPSSSKLAPPALALSAALALLLGFSGPPADLAALGEDLLNTDDFQDVDDDLDGIPDVQEIIMGTDPAMADSDGDGYSDLEEFARQSDPNEINSIPKEGSVNVGMTARVEENTLHVLTALYLRHDETAGYGVEIGIMVDGLIAPIPPQVFLFGSTFSITPGKEPGDRIALLDTPYPTIPVHDLSQLSFWSRATPSAADEDVEVATLDLFSDPEGPEIVRLEFVDHGESIYRPLNIDPPAMSWSPGQICVQRSANVGNVGAVSEHLVESATCETADAYCSPTCPSFAGSSFQVIDPLALLGG